jgi:hypothetical protein
MVNPFEPTEPLRYTGEVWSTEELFVVRVIAENDGASLPATSCMAVLVVAVSTLGAAYATVTVFPLPTAELRVSTTVLVPEAVATEETGIVTPPLVTVKALASAVVVERFSL